MLDLRKPNEVALAALSIVVVLLGVSGFILYRQQRAVTDSLAQMHQANIDLAKQIDIPSQIVEKVVSKTVLWRPIQEEARDTVVQVVVAAFEFDLCQPYRTPQQYTSYGSGFFINEQGDIITNAHVVAQARSVWVQIPSLGREIIDVEVIGMAPDRDLALLRVKPEALEMIKNKLGKIPYLPLGDSDLIGRSDEVMALGYPLAQQSLKSTTGVISGREQHMIQISAAINPGSSGGPLINELGQVIGINSSGITEAQNIGYAIPVNDWKIIEPEIRKTKLLRKPFLGVLYNNASEALTEYLGNPQPGGCYVVEVLPNSTLERAGVKPGDMLYEINGHRLDIFGDMSVPWSEDKISVIDYVSRIPVGEHVRVVVYRKGDRKELSITFDLSELPAIRKVFPGYETIDYEVFAGMVVMQLTINHIQMMEKVVPGLVKFAEMKHQSEPVLLITHIFGNSQLYRTRIITPGSTITDINGVKVTTLDQLRELIKDCTYQKFLTIRAADHMTRASDNLLVVLEWDRVLAEEHYLAHDYHYPISETIKELIAARMSHNTISGGALPVPLA